MQIDLLRELAPSGGYEIINRAIELLDTPLPTQYQTLQPLTLQNLS